MTPTRCFSQSAQTQQPGNSSANKSFVAESLVFAAFLLSRSLSWCDTRCAVSSTIADKTLNAVHRNPTRLLCQRRLHHPHSRCVHRETHCALSLTICSVRQFFHGTAQLQAICSTRVSYTRRVYPSPISSNVERFCGNHCFE
jgi:hypothetical protein